MNVFNIGVSKIFVNSFKEGLSKRFIIKQQIFNNLSIFFSSKIESIIFEEELKLSRDLVSISNITQVYALDSITTSDSKFNLNQNILYKPPLSLFEQEFIFRNLVFKHCKITNFAQGTTIAKEIIFLMNEINKNQSNYFTFEDISKEKYEKKFIDVFEHIIGEYQNYLQKYRRSDPLVNSLAIFEGLINFLCESPPQDPVIIVVSSVANLNYLKTVKKLLNVQNCYIILYGFNCDIDDHHEENLEKNHHQYAWKIFLDYLELRKQDIVEWDMLDLKPNNFINEVFRSSFSIDRWCSSKIQSNEDINLKILEVEDIYTEAQSIMIYIKDLLLEDSNIYIATEDIIFINYLKNLLSLSDINYQDFVSKNYKENHKFVLFMLFSASLQDDKKTSISLSLLSHKKILAKIFNKNCTNPLSKIINFLNTVQSSEIESLSPDAIDFADIDFLNLVKFYKNLSKIKELSNKVTFKDWLESHLKIFNELLSEQENEVFIEDEEGIKLFEFLNDLASNSGNIEIHSFSEYIHYLEAAVSSFTNKIKIISLAKVNFIHPQDITFFCGEIIIIPSFDDSFWPNKNKFTTALVSQQFKNYTNIIDEYKYAGFTANALYKVFSNSKILITRSLYRGYEHTTASRWLTRLKIVAEAYGLTNKIFLLESFRSVLKSMNNNIKEKKIDPPIAYPSLQLRPNKITASKVEMLIKNPYAYYAHAILKLSSRPNFYSVEDNKNYGSFIHYVLDYYTKNKLSIKDFTLASFNQLLAAFFAGNIVNKEKKVFWYLKLINILKWFEEYSRLSAEDYKIYSEVNGEYKINVAGSIFKIFARADRIIVSKCNNFIEIIDYKTGTLPRKIDTDNLSEGVQLVLEALIALNNGFTAIDYLNEPKIKIAYISLKGNELAPKLKEIDFSENNSIIREVEEKITEVFIYYSNQLNGYNSKTIYTDYKTDFDQLMRKKEFSSYN